jgi:hypothetical protein
MIKRYDPGLKSRVREKSQPVLAPEQSLDMPVVFHANGSVGAAQHVDVVSQVCRVRRIGIPRPLEESQRVCPAVVPAMISRGLEGLSDVIRGEERGASRS